MRYGPPKPRTVDEKRRADLLDAACRVPADRCTPDWIIYAEGLDPSDTFIQTIADVRLKKLREEQNG